MKNQEFVPNLIKYDNKICDNIFNSTIFKNDKIVCIKFCITDDFDVLPQCVLINYYINYKVNLAPKTFANTEQNSSIELNNHETASVAGSGKKDSTLVASSGKDTVAVPARKIEKTPEVENPINSVSIDVKKNQTDSQLTENHQKINNKDLSNAQAHAETQVQKSEKPQEIVESENIGAEPLIKSAKTQEQQQQANGTNSQQIEDAKHTQKDVHSETKTVDKNNAETNLNDGSEGQDNIQLPEGANIAEEQNEQTVDDGDDDNDLTNREIDSGK